MKRAGPGGPVGDAAWVAGWVGASGVLAGVLWSWLAEGPAVTRTDFGLVTLGADVGSQFGVDGWFAVLGAVLGGACGVAAGWRRNADPLGMLLLVVVGSLGAAAVAALLGGALGPPDPQAVLASAEVGARAPAELRTYTPVVYLAWPLGAAAGFLLAQLARGDGEPGSGRPARSRRPDAAPPLG